eukprot:gene16507-18153_t
MVIQFGFITIFVAAFLWLRFLLWPTTFLKFALTAISLFVRQTTHSRQSSGFRSMVQYPRSCCKDCRHQQCISDSIHIKQPCRYRDFRDTDGSLTIFYWHLLALNLALSFFLSILYLQRIC